MKVPSFLIIVMAQGLGIIPLVISQFHLMPLAYPEEEPAPPAGQPSPTRFHPLLAHECKSFLQMSVRAADPLVRYIGVLALTELDEPEFMPLIASMIEDPDKNIHELTIHFLYKKETEIGKYLWPKYLQMISGDPARVARGIGLGMLARPDDIVDKSQTLTLLELLGHHDPLVRKEAAWSLRLVKNTTVIERLQVLFADENKVVATAAAAALYRLGSLEMIEMLERQSIHDDRDVSVMATRALCDDMEEQTILDALALQRVLVGSKDTYVKALAAIGLGNSTMESSFDLLATRMTDCDEKERVGAAGGLLIWFKRVSSEDSVVLDQDAELDYLRIFSRAALERFKKGHQLADIEHLLLSILNDKECLGNKLFTSCQVDLDLLKSRLELAMGDARYQKQELEKLETILLDRNYPDADHAKVILEMLKPRSSRAMFSQRFNRVCESLEELKNKLGIKKDRSDLLILAIFLQETHWDIRILHSFPDLTEPAMLQFISKHGAVQREP